MGHESSRTAATQRGTRPAVCSKCGHENRPGSNTCEKCGSHLWVVCHHCGQRNLRADTQCAECGGRLHRSALKRASKKIFGDRRRITPWQIGLLLAAVWFAYRVIVWFAEYRPPEPE